jgi:fermentation-respiration switch protein FrsA (DUF1100 family)
MLSMLLGCVERMFFYPDARDYGHPRQLGLHVEELQFATADGSLLHGWFIRARGTARGSVLHLHGNAANVTNHWPLISWLPDAGFNVLMFDYRGFGKSQGKPTLDGVVQDAQAALVTLRARSEVDPQRIVVYGHSLGGATALRLLAEDAPSIRLGVIEAAFDSYRGIAREAAGVGLRTVLAPAIASLPPADRDPIAALARVDGPLLFVHGTDDQVIPFAHGERLYAAAREPKQWLPVRGAAHMEAGQVPAARAAILEAMRRAVQPDGRAVN